LKVIWEFLLCDRRRRVAIAFWISLVWVVFSFQGLESLQVESVKVGKSRRKVAEGCRKAISGYNETKKGALNEK